jgi:hypothetical protein
MEDAGSIHSDDMDRKDTTEGIDVRHAVFITLALVSSCTATQPTGRYLIEFNIHDSIELVRKSCGHARALGCAYIRHPCVIHIDKNSTPEIIAHEVRHCVDKEFRHEKI